MTNTAAERYANGLNAIEQALPEPYCTYKAEKPGSKYTRVTKNTGIEYGTSVHAFVENATGSVYKPSGWSVPAKGARFATVEDALAKAAENPAHAFSGGYLYAGR